MRDIYLIDFENVASEGLSGITSLSPEDEVMIFYSSSSNRLSMKMHILIGKSVCKFDYFEVTVGGKNALDHQISTWLGFLIGTNAAERNYYIVSKDMGYRFVASFWTSSGQKVNVHCIENIRAAGRLERSRQAKEQREAESKEAQPPEPEKAESAEKAEAEAPKEEPAVCLPAPSKPEEAEPIEEDIPTETQTARSRQRYRKGRAKSGRTGASSSNPQQRESEKPKPASSAEPEHDVAQSTQSELQLEVERAPVPLAERQPELSEEQRETDMEKIKKVQKSGQQGVRIPNKPENRPRRVDLQQLLAPYPDLQESELQQLIHDNKRQVLCNTLRKQLGQEKGLALYNEIKRSVW